jgi:AcrR family transcriptional regulator
LARPASVNGKKSGRSDVASRRRGEIVEAAIAVIAERGIQHLSLSAIEERAGMARGQLTYYFPAKEDILLAVFDRLLALMYQRIGTPQGAAPCEEDQSCWEWVRHLLEAILLRPPASPEFHCLQYTFLAQMGHREDFRARLASLYEGWRGHMAQGLAADLAGSPAAEPRLLASLVQALLHGLAMQLAADPAAFDREAMFRLCLDVLGGHLGRNEPPAPSKNNKPARRAPQSRGKS